MRHYLAECNFLVKRIVRLKIGQILLDRSVQVEFTSLNKLHDADVREELGNRTDAVDGFGAGGDFFVRVGIAEPLRPNNLLIIDQGDRKCGKLLVLPFMLNEFRYGLSNGSIVSGRANGLWKCRSGAAGRNPVETECGSGRQQQHSGDSN